MKNLPIGKIKAASYFVLVLLVFWLFFFTPLLDEIKKTSFQISSLRQEISAQTIINANALFGINNKKNIVLYPRGEQLSKIVEFIDLKFKILGAKLTSMKQSSEENRLTINLNFETRVPELLKFLDSLSELNTLLIIDNIHIYQQGWTTFIKMRILSGYL